MTRATHHRISDPSSRADQGLVEPGRVVLVATPIGNLGDLSPRAVETLATADTIYCEDTRRTRGLLTHAGITGKRLLSLHEHNEMDRIPGLLDRVASGEVVAVVSDAGMPGISDPGSRLVVAAIANETTVDAIPGPNAALTALVLSGLPMDRFCFEGFLPRKGVERQRRLSAFAGEARTIVLYESPSRVGATLADLKGACGGRRELVIARELTKVHQEIWRGTLDRRMEDFGDHNPRGEVVIVLGGAEKPAEADDEQLAAALGRRMDAGDSLRDCATAVASELSVSRRRAYEMALELRRETGNGDIE